jgi:hypothetical protein
VEIVTAEILYTMIDSLRCERNPSYILKGTELDRLPFRFFDNIKMYIIFSWVVVKELW